MIKFSVRVLSLGGTENSGRCPSTVIENRTGGRKRRRNDHPSVWSDTVLSPVTKRFQTVEIDLRDDTGSIVPFERGRLVVTLHCRKRKEFSLEWNQLIVAIRKLTTIIAYTKPEKDIRYLWEYDIKEDMDLAVSLEDSLKQPCLCWRRGQRP